MLNTNEKIIKHKLGLLNLAEELGNVSRASKVMGLSRDTFYRYKAAVVAYVLEEPAHSQTRASNELRKRGVFISPSGVRCVWLRHELACFRDRLKALVAKMA